MKPSRGTNTKPSTSDQTKLTILPVLIGVGLLLLITFLIFLVSGRISFPAAQAQPTALPTLFIPTVDCGPPTLVLGVTTYKIETISLPADGPVGVPSDVNGTAYWIEGTDLQYVFMLSPTEENLSLLTSLPEGISATVTWSNCNSTTFMLSAPQPGDFEIASPPDQTTASILIFLQLDPTGEGFMVSGEVTGEEIHTFNTPAADSSEVLAEIGLVGTTVSADGSSIQVSVSIYNFSNTAFTVSSDDVSLTAVDGSSLDMIASEPPLPKEVAPLATETFTFTFLRPSTPTAILKIFTVEYDVEGY